MSSYSGQFETLIQLSGTFVALISGFAVSRYFSNLAEVQRLSYERRFIEPKLESLNEQVISQKELRQGNEAARIFRELIDLFNVNDGYSDKELVDLLESDLTEVELVTLISEFRAHRKKIEEEISKKVGVLIPSPVEQTLTDLNIPFTPRNLSIYLDGLRRYRDKKRSELGISNPFHLNLQAFDALTRQSFSISHLYEPLNRRRTESENLELLLEVEHQDKMLQTEIQSRKLGMKMKYFVVSTSLNSAFGIIIPMAMLIFPNMFNKVVDQVILALATLVTVGSSYAYVYMTVQSNKFID
jgi:hypothetical protein